MGPDQFRLHAELEETHWWFTGRRTIARHIVQRILPPEHGGTVVDVGCGTGANIASLADRYDTIGIDPSKEAISLASRRYPGVRFLCGTAPDDLGVIATTADLFLLMDVLEHVPDDRRVLTDLLTVSKPGAHVLITVPAHMSLWSGHDVAFGHYRRYDIPMLCKVWEGLPVTVRTLSYFNSRLYPVVRLVRSIRSWKDGTSGRSRSDLARVPRVINRVLNILFAGESKALVKSIDANQATAHRFGVSLLAVLRREPGSVGTQAPAGSHPAMFVS